MPGKLINGTQASYRGNASSYAITWATPANPESKCFSGRGTSRMTVASAPSLCRYRQNWNVSPKPCSACTRIVLPLTGSSPVQRCPCQFERPNLGDTVIRQSYNCQP